MQENTYTSRSGYSVASFCLGIIAIIPIVGILFAVLSIIFGTLALKEIKRENKKGKGLAVTGLILGTIFLLINAMGVYLVSKGETLHEEFLKTPKGQEVSKEAGEAALSGMIGVIEKYKIDNGKYPDTIYDLQEKEEKDTEVDNYVRYKKNADGTGYEVEFVGLDKVWGTADDARLSK